MSRAKNWCFTLNNYTNTDVINIDESIMDDGIKYLCYGKEIGANGTPHLQGFIMLSRRKSLVQLRRLMESGCLDRAHLEVARQNAARNITYCEKEGDFHKFGERPGGNNNRDNGIDFDGILVSIQEGATLQEIATSNAEAFIRYATGIRALYQLLSQALEPRIQAGPFFWSLPNGFDWSTSLYLYGESGIGKTQWALTLFERPLIVTHMDQLRLFDARRFDGIVFDDMSFNHMPRESQIHICDQGQPRAIHVRYGLAHIPAETKKVFTSNVAWDHAFVRDRAVWRRLSVFRLTVRSMARVVNY